MGEYTSAAVLLAFAPLLALRMHRLRVAGGAAMAPRWRAAALISGGMLVVGVALLVVRPFA
jgi:hypothetical protein